MKNNVKLIVENVFVDYKFEPFECHRSDVLYEFLLTEVWSDFSDPSEDLRPEHDLENSELISTIRYQFPDIEHARDRCNEVGMLLIQAVEKWRVVGQWRE